MAAEHGLEIIRFCKPSRLVATNDDSESEVIVRLLTKPDILTVKRNLSPGLIFSVRFSLSICR